VTTAGAAIPLIFAPNFQFFHQVTRLGLGLGLRLGLGLGLRLELGLGLGLINVGPPRESSILTSNSSIRKCLFWRLALTLSLSFVACSASGG